MARFFPALTPSDPVSFGPGLGVHPLRAGARGADLPMPELEKGIPEGMQRLAAEITGASKK